MAERSSNEEDPSIEEILDSIRRIISDDVMDGPAPEPEPEPVVVAVEPESEPEPVFIMPEPEPEPVFVEPEPEARPEPEPVREEEVLVLTDKVDDIEEPAAAPQPEPDATTAEQIVEEQISKQPLQVDLRDAQEPKPEPVIDSFENDAVFTEKAEAEAYEAISGLARKVALGRGSLTLEEIVRQELKPLLRGWLHQNLSAVIDRLVREELERVSNRVLEK